MHSHRSLLALAAIATLVTAACGSDTDARADAESASVSFATPADGDTVTSPVAWEADVDGVTIEPAGEVNEGAGHLHVLVDQECVPAGEVIGKDEGQNHFGDGSTSGELELQPGEHTLCLQLADGEHTATDVTATITVAVE